MGCCCSTEDNNSVEAENGDRNCLIQDSSNGCYPINNSSNDYTNTYGHSALPKADDHSALHKVLHQVSNDVIDVGALDCRALEEREYGDRGRVYARQLGLLTNIAADIPPGNLFVKVAVGRGQALLVDVAATEKSLGATPMPHSDFAMMNSASERVGCAVEAIGHVHLADHLVAYFGGQS